MTVGVLSFYSVLTAYIYIYICICIRGEPFKIYAKNHLRYIRDERTFRIDTDDLSQQNLHKVRNWVRKWERAGVLEESVCN